MKRIALIAAVAASLSAPAFAQSASDFALQHFNQDIDSVLDVRIPGGASDGTVTVSTQSRPGLAAAFANFNADKDSLGDLRGLNGVTLTQNTPSNAADIFARIRAEGLENE